MKFKKIAAIPGIALGVALVLRTFAQNGLSQAASAPPAIFPLKARGITNFYQLTPQIFSGSAPVDEKSFAELKELGVKTMITVDGAYPDTNNAARFGIRCVHLPFPYSGISSNEALRLAKAGRTLPAPIFVNCKHGVNRGPTAAAIICMANAGWTSDDAEAWLKMAGTSHEYSGLFKSIIRFKRPTAEILARISDSFAGAAETNFLRDTMVALDRHFDNLALIKKSNYSTPASHPDLNPEKEAEALDSLFAALEKSDAVKDRGEDFLHDLHRARTFADSLHNLLIASPQNVSIQPKLFELRDDMFLDVKDSCVDCHRDFRNQ